jgi:hypothetical protein
VSALGNITLEAFDLSDRTKVQVLGSAVEDEKKRMEQILRNRDTQTRVRQVTSPALESRLTDGQRFMQTDSPQVNPKGPL